MRILASGGGIATPTRQNLHTPLPALCGEGVGGGAAPLYQECPALKASGEASQTKMQPPRLL